MTNASRDMFRRQIDVFERLSGRHGDNAIIATFCQKTDHLVCVMSGNRTMLVFQRSRTFIKFRQTIFADGVRIYVINTLEMPLFTVHR